MFSKILFACSFLIGTSAHSVAMTNVASTGNKVGLGIAFSGPVGVSVYGDLSDSRFVQAAFAVGRTDNLAATVDYAFPYYQSIAAIPSMTPFWGLGMIALRDRSNYWIRRNDGIETSETYLGARIPLGLNFVIPRTPVQLGGEVAPTLIVAPINYSYVEVGLHVRVLF